MIASKMRIWLTGKKQSVISRLTNDEQSEEETKAALEKAQEKLDEIVQKIIEKATFII